MKYIELIKDFGDDAAGGAETDKKVNELFNGPFRRIVEVRLRNNAVLSRHKAQEPITVFCVSGAGIFTAGPNLEDAQNMRAGTLITLEGGVEHEVTADGDLHLIVTKFKDN